jgi:hypothetical protein
MALCLISLSACFSVKTMYNQADWLLPSYLDDYVSLNEQQNNLFRLKLEHSLEWHRRQQLPEYASFIEWLAAAAADGLDHAEIDTVYKELRQFGDILVEVLVPQMTQIIQAMDDHQLTELYENLEVNNQRFKAKHIDSSEIEQRERLAEKKLNFIERWAGSVNDDQKDLVLLWSRATVLMGKEYYQSRQNWQGKLKQILLRRDEKTFLEMGLLTLIKDRRKLRSEDFNTRYHANENLDKKLYLQLDRSLSSRQREYMVTRLKGIANDFRELAAQKS